MTADGRRETRVEVEHLVVMGRERDAGRHRRPERDTRRASHTAPTSKSRKMPRDEEWSEEDVRDLSGRRETRGGASVQHICHTAPSTSRKPKRAEVTERVPSSEESESEAFAESGSEFSESDGDDDESSTRPTTLGVRTALWHTAGRTVMAARSMLASTSARRGTSQSRGNDGSDASSFDDESHSDDDVSLSSQSDSDVEHGKHSRHAKHGTKHPTSALKRSKHSKKHQQKRVISSTSNSKSESDSDCDVESGRGKSAKKSSKPIIALSKARQRQAQQAAHVMKASFSAERKEKESRKQKQVSFAKNTNVYATSDSHPETGPLLGVNEPGSRYPTNESCRQYRKGYTNGRNNNNTTYSGVYRLVILSALALIGVVMLSAGARSVFLANDEPAVASDRVIAHTQDVAHTQRIADTHHRVAVDRNEAVDTASRAKSATRTHSVDPFFVAGIREADDTGRVAASTAGASVTQEEVQSLIDAAVKSALRKKEELTEELAEGGVEVVDQEKGETVSPVEFVNPVGESEETTDDASDDASGDDLFDDALFDDAVNEVAEEQDARVEEQIEQAVEPEERIDEAEIVADVPEDEPSHEDETQSEYPEHEPHITPDMTYDEQQAEYARFAAAEAEYNDRVAAEAAESVRRNAEESVAKAQAEQEIEAQESVDPVEESRPVEEEVEDDQVEEVEEDNAEDDSVAAIGADVGTLSVGISSYPTLVPGERLMIEVPDDVNDNAQGVVEKRPLTVQEELQRAASVAGLGTD